MGGAASPESDAKVLAAPLAAARLRLQLLNLPCLMPASGSAHVLERKDAALLAMLAVEGPTPRNKAAALLWPDIDEERARNSLRQRLFRLRRLAAGDVVRPGAMLALAENVRHDLEALGPRLADDPDAAIGELLGELDYGDCFELAEWVSVARDQWRTARRNALAEIAARLEADGRIAPALHYAQRLVADDPTLEHAHRRVMRLHYLRGDRAAALAAFERCRELLKQQVGAQPSRETLELARLIESSGTLPQPAPAAKPVAILRPPRLVGREREWRALEQAPDSVRAVVVAGEAGMGKTRLLSDFAAANGNALVVGSRPGDSRVPYALLAALLRALVRRHGAPADDWVGAELAHVLPELGAASGKFEPLRLRLAMARAVEHWHEAGLQLLAVDDLHFADEATLEVLPALVLAAEARVVWLFGVRANELPASVRGWLAQQDAGTFAQVALGPLDEPAVRELIDSLALPGVDTARLAPLLVRHTGGNPLFMLETLGALLAQGAHAAPGGPRLPAPASVGELIERRLRQLSPNALKLARVAALAGQDFSAALAAHVLGVHALDLSEPWRELEAAHLLRDNAFAHDLILETAQRSVPAPIAAVLHRDVAAYLETHDAPAARIAQHWLEGGNWRAAGRQFRAAAAAAAKASQRAEEARLLERAVECFERVGDQPALFDALHELAESYLVFSNITAARSASERLLREARTDVQRLLAMNAHADSLNVAREHEAAAALAAQMLALAQEVGDERAAFNASRKLAGAQATLGQYHAALAVHEAQRAWADAHPDDSDVRVYLCDRGYLLEQATRSAAAIDAYRDAIRIALAQRDLAVAHAGLTNLAVTLWRLGRLPEAIDSADEARRLRAELGTADDDAAVDIAQRAAILRDLGRLGEALADLEAAVQALARKGSLFWKMAAEDHLAVVFVRIGQHGRAQSLLAGQPPHADAAALAHRSICRAQLARHSGKSGLDAASAARELAARGAPWRMQLLAAFEYAAACDPRAGGELCRDLVDETRRRGADGLHMHALMRMAECDLRAHRFERASDAAAQALSRLKDRSPFGLSRLEFLWIAHKAFALAGDATAARSALQQGMDWIRDIVLPKVPDEFRSSFESRNPFCRAMLTAATQQMR